MGKRSILGSSLKPSVFHARVKKKKITKTEEKHTSDALKVADSLASVRSKDVVSGKSGFSRQTRRA